MQPGSRTMVRIPVRGYLVPVLRITTDHADYVGGDTPNARFLAVRIPSITYGSERTKQAFKEPRRAADSSFEGLP